MEHLMKLELKKVHFKNYILLSALMIALSMFFIRVCFHHSFFSLKFRIDHQRVQ